MFTQAIYGIDVNDRPLEGRMPGANSGADAFRKNG